MQILGLMRLALLFGILTWGFIVTFEYGDFDFKPSEALSDMFASMSAGSKDDFEAFGLTDEGQKATAFQCKKKLRYDISRRSAASFRKKISKAEICTCIVENVSDIELIDKIQHILLKYPLSIRVNRDGHTIRVGSRIKRRSSLARPLVRVANRENLPRSQVQDVSNHYFSTVSTCFERAMT